MPRVEAGLVPGVVGVEGADEPPERVIELCGADPSNPTDLHPVVRCEERLVLAHRLAFVVEDRPTTGDPPKLHIGTARLERAGLSADLLLNLTAEAVGVGEAQPKPTRLAGRHVGG